MASKRQKGIIFKIGEEMSAKGLEEDHPRLLGQALRIPPKANGRGRCSLLRGEVTPNINIPVMMILLVTVATLNLDGV